jgi:arylsulfatase A-like enzyme
MEVVDRNIGRLLSQLDELGLRENTIVVYTSDGSGAACPRELVDTAEKNYVSSCPAIISWPGGDFQAGQQATELIANIDMAPTFLDMCGITPSRTNDFDGQSFYGLISATGELWKDRVYIADHQSRSGNRQVILRPLHGTTVFMPQGDVPFRDGKSKGRSPELEALAREHWEAWWKDVTTDFQPYQYVVVGTEHANPMFAQHAYTESAADEEVARYVMPVEFAHSGNYVFSAPYDDPSSTKPEVDGIPSSNGYLMIGEEKHEGTFPMTRYVEVGRQLLRVSLDGKRTDKALRIERVIDR